MRVEAVPASRSCASRSVISEERDRARCPCILRAWGQEVAQVATSGVKDPRGAPPPSAAGIAARARRRTFQRRRDRRGLWFVLPFFVIFLMFLVVPLAYSVYTSFLHDTHDRWHSFHRVSNYTHALGDGAFWTGMGRTFLFAAIQVADHGRSSLPFSRRSSTWALPGSEAPSGQCSSFHLPCPG